MTIYDPEDLGVLEDKYEEGYEEESLMEMDLREYPPLDWRR